MERLSEIPNSLYAAVFKPEMRRDLHLPPQNLMDNLASISALYIYSNPPPMGYGTPAPKTAATIIRTREYNRKENNKTFKSGPFTIDNTMWENEGNFPFDVISSNFHPGEVHRMSVDFLIENQRHITKCAESSIERAMSRNSDILTKGKQTWCPLVESSLPCPQAYMNMCEWMELNGKPKKHTLMEFIKYFLELSEKETLIKQEVYYTYSDKKRSVTKQIRGVRRKMKKVRTIQTEGQSFQITMDILRSFCSYLKHGERAHLDRRAICSANVILRALFHVTEEMHLDLGKLIEGSTISIGGEEKKNKIVDTMLRAFADAKYPLTLQATEDQTKWNECVGPNPFCMFSRTLFNDDIRAKYRLPLMSQSEKLMGKILETTHYVLAIKMITLGNGLQGKTDIHHGEISWDQCEGKINASSWEWFSKIKDLMYGNCYVQSSGGMLMGMHNALSTTYGLIAAKYNLPYGSMVNTLRSSDDSMTLYSADTPESMAAVMDKHRMNHKLAGMNHSGKKSFIFPARYGEYTSWFQDGKMVSQFGTETTKLRPGGNNPPDDFYGIVKSTAVSLMNLESNPIGAEAKIRLGISNVRSLYRIKRKGDPTDPISAKVRVLSNGGLNPWNCTNCHLEETSLKETFATNEAEKGYFLKIRNPENPFIGDPVDAVTWSKDAGTLSMDQVDTPLTIFHYVKKGNRSIKNVKGKTHEDAEREHNQALQLVNLADVSTLLRVQQSGTMIASHMISSMYASSSTLDLSESELQTLNEAIAILRHGPKPCEDEDLMDYLSD